MRTPAGNGSAAASPPVVAALVAEDPSLPAGDGWHLVVPRRIWRRLDQGPSPPTRRQEPARHREPRPVPTDLFGHAAEQQVAAEAPAAAAAEGCGGREGEVGRRGGSAGIGECRGFFYSTRGEERGEVRSVIRTLVARTRAAGAPGGETVRVEAGGYESLDHVEAL